MIQMPMLHLVTEFTGVPWAILHMLSTAGLPGTFWALMATCRAAFLVQFEKLITSSISLRCCFSPMDSSCSLETTSILNLFLWLLLRLWCYWKSGTWDYSFFILLPLPKYTTKENIIMISFSYHSILGVYWRFLSWRSALFFLNWWIRFWKFALRDLLWETVEYFHLILLLLILLNHLQCYSFLPMLLPSFSSLKD